ncbi:MAG: AAA family ATPase [Clostridia bacterium]|nr:AAA family ATPase [Clostridia bacterium]
MQSTETSDLITLYSNVHSVPVRWLWYPFIAIGKITLIQGDPGDGKSTMMMHLIAELSNGGYTPDGKAVGAPRKVIYQCSEDGVEDTIKPRLEDSGANCDNVAFIDEEKHSGLTLDDERIREAIKVFKPALVVIDPIQAYLESDSDLQIAVKARKLMRRLALWASTYNCAIVMIGHLNKKESSKGLYRSLGSIDVVAAARSVLQVERDEEDADVRIVRQIKNSLAPSNGEVRFEIRPQSGFRWISCNECDALKTDEQDALPNTKADKAAFCIKEMLKSTDMASKEIMERLSELGISKRTAEKVKKEMGVYSYRLGGNWYWSLGEIRRKK